MLNRTSFYVIFFIVILILLSIIEPSIKVGLFIAIMITLFKYLDTFLHELGHFLTGKLVGYEIERVVIGDRKQVFSLEVFGTSFIFCYGFGGLTVIGSSVKNSKLRLSAFALGGVMLQVFVISIVYILLGIGSEENYFLPLIFMILNLKTIVFNLYPRIFTQYGKEYPSDGLLLKRIIKTKEIN
ncbi:hypothetical protein PMSD_06075 [Paenibacillus macquariensis subsp. defensor]|nr:hypothetical protein PMSD_06075 [Paenibacillus macquariensis subsp. defensor]